MFTVRWKFKNDHMWEKSFDSPELRDSFINSVGLVSHPDIVRITVMGNGSSIKDIVIKDVNFSSPDPVVGDNMSGNQLTSIYASYK